ncbi:DUF1080 domain-containing protein [Bacteroides sp. OttesenSCG-928-D19]|nr:DUF1080 domain-containing protein [Bacteroides sp. OttesenSCG-928-D19]
MKKKMFFIGIALSLFVVSIQAQTEELFNGKDLSNWNFVVDGDKVPAEEVFSVQDGVILIHGEPLGYMYTKKKYKNYTLELEWSWVDGASNSGIFLLIADPKNPFPNGIECQLKAGLAGDFVLLGGSDMDEYVTPADGRPKFPVIQKRADSSEKPVGEWNKAKIEVRDGKVTVYINEVLQNQGTNQVKEGYIGLQSEGGPVQFRNLKLTNQ